MLARFAEYGDAVVGRFGSSGGGGGAVYPGVRAVVKPLLGLFHNAPGGKRWRHVLDQELLKKPATVSEVLQVRWRAPVPPAFRWGLLPVVVWA